MTNSSRGRIKPCDAAQQIEDALNKIPVVGHHITHFCFLSNAKEWS